MKTSKGFTMIELIVVIAIVTILPAIVIANFYQIKSQYNLSRAASRFALDVRRAQNLAFASVPYKDSFNVPHLVAGYGVYLDLGSLGSKKYIIYGDQHPGNQKYDSGDYIIDTIDFSSSESGVVIKEIENVVGTKASIDFSPPNPDTTINQLQQNQNTVNVVFALESDPTKIKIVSVNTAGLVEIK